MGPIYGPEDLLGGWVSKRKKRKADPGLHLPPPKKRAIGDTSKLDCREVCDSDADDEDDLAADENNGTKGQQGAEDTQCDKGQQGTERQDDDGQQPAEQARHDEPLAKDATPSPRSLSGSPSADLVVSIAATDPTIGHVVGSIEGAKEHVRATSVPVIPSTQDSASSQSSSDSQNQVAKIEKDAKAALHRFEVATTGKVLQPHRGALIRQSLALAGHDALESFRQACSYWRSDYASKASQGLVARIPDIDRHPALERFAQAYSTATNTTRRRAVLDVLHRINLAYLYDVYLETLDALSRFSLQQNPSRPNASCRALDTYDKDVREVAQDQMFWACYPAHVGKARRGLDQAFKVTLKNAEKWHTLREEFNLGVLALVPPGTNNWFEKLPLAYIPAYFSLIQAVNPLAVSMGEIISDRVFLSWKGVEPPKQLLRIEHMEAVHETDVRANPLELLEEINIGCTTRVGAGRAVTVPVGVDENDPAALNAVFSSMTGLSQGNNEYPLPPGFFDGIDFPGV